MATETLIPAHEVPRNEDFGVCAGCTHVCCDNMPCETWPYDVSKTVEGLTQAIVDRLKTGRWAVDWWEGDVMGNPHEGYTRSLYLRPACQGKEGKLEDASWGGACTFYTPGKGCSLSWEERPTGGKSLIPNAAQPGCCGDGDSGFGGKDSAAKAWYSYQSHIIDALRITRRLVA